MHASASSPRRRQRGTSLLEALIAFVVLATGVLAIGRAQLHLRLDSDIARQRSEAVRLAQADLENLRAFSVMAAAPAVRSYDQISSTAAVFDSRSGEAGNTSYRLRRDVQSSNDAKSAAVTVSWDDRRGAERHIVLTSIIAANDPAYSAALGFRSAAAAVRGAYGRSAFIPLSARNLGDGRSAFKPVALAGVVYVFDNASGLVSARCTAGDAMTPVRDLTNADLTHCDTRSGYLLSGPVRFSRAVPPDARAANETPLALALRLSLNNGTYPASPSCASEALKTVSYSSGNRTVIDSVPIAATSSSLGLAAWSESGDRFVAYHCIVYPLANGRWSGQSTLVPSGWTIGNGVGDWHVCRFIAEAAGSAGVDSNRSRPMEYVAVSGPLTNQNFLVIDGSQACPAVVSEALRGTAVRVATAPHQP